MPIIPKVKEELRRMETLGVVEKVTHPPNQLVQSNGASSELKRVSRHE